MASRAVNADLLDLLPAAALLCEPPGVITRYNRLAVELWGREPERAVVDALADVLREGTTLRERETVIERADGARIAVALNANPIRDDAGVVVGALVVVRDLSDSKRLEAALAESATILESVIRRLFPAARTVRARPEPDGRLEQAWPDEWVAAPGRPVVAIEGGE